MTLAFDSANNLGQYIAAGKIMFQINEELPFDRSELGGALKEAINNAVQEIL